MTESEVRKLLRQMKELDSQTAFRDFYNMTYDRLFRIAAGNRSRRISETMETA